MTLKDLLVLGNAGMETASAYGMWLAGATGASLTAAIPVIQPSFPPGMAAEFPSDILSRIQDDAEALATQTIQGFMQAAEEANTKADVVRFETIAGDAGYAFSRLARCFDVSILSQPNSNGVDTDAILKATLFGSGRPLLIVPYIRTNPQITTALIAWDGGIQSARAASDALPFIKLARKVQIVTVEREAKKPHHSGRDLARHLARHGIEAEIKPLPGEDIDVASMLLSHAADSGGDLIVMGGYGHSRLREFVLGGTTREILRSMTVPVLMSH